MLHDMKETPQLDGVPSEMVTWVILSALNEDGLRIRTDQVLLHTPSLFDFRRKDDPNGVKT